MSDLPFNLPEQQPSELQAARARFCTAEKARDESIAALSREWRKYFPSVALELDGARMALDAAEQSELNQQKSSVRS